MKLALRVCWPGSDRGRSRRTMKTVVAVLLGVGAAIAATNASAQSASAPEQAGPFGSLEIRDVTVIDGSGAPAFGPVNIYIKGNRIERVVSVDAIARERREEEGTGAKERETRRADRVIEIGRDTSELQSPDQLVCRPLLEKKQKNSSPSLPPRLSTTR